MREDHPITLEAVCLLPDHLHCLWTLPEGDSDYSVRWGRLKSEFSRLYRARGVEEGQRSASRSVRGERGFWQRRFWEHRIREEEDFARHFDYIHYNPVKHGLAARPEEWPWSTFHRYARLGWYDTGWGRDIPPGLDDMDVAGE
jgi:putative transposase